MWLVAIALAVPLLMWMFQEMRSLDVPQSQAFLDYNSERVEQFQEQTAAGAVGVVVMGDSRVRYGTEWQDDLAAELSDHVGHEVAVLRLTYDWATYEDFEPLMPMIFDAQPAMVILQEELRLKNRGYDASEAIKREYLWWKILGSGVWNPGGNDQDYYQEENTCEAVGVQELDVRLVRLNRWVNFDADGPAAQKVSRLTDDLKSRDIELRYLHVPISSDARTVLPGVEVTGSPIGLAPDITFDDVNYCDYVHMDPVARADYTDWFITAVADELSAATDRTRP